MSDFDFDFDDLLKVHNTKLHIPFESSEENSSCSVQLTNMTHLLVAYRILSLSPDRVVVSRDEDTYVGTILPKSTCFVTVNGLKETRISSLFITAYPVRNGVKAEDITKEINLHSKAFLSRGFCELHVVYYKLDSCSAAVHEKNEKKSLLDDDENKLGSDYSVKRRLSDKISSIVLFSDQEIEAATNDSSGCSKIGQGGYGAVFKCVLHGTEVAIKTLDTNSKQGIDEFRQEMEVLGRMRHPNLVKLIGACIERCALIYEFLPHGSLGDCLQKNPEILTWQIRTRIVYEIFSALTFLHSIKPQPVVHGDLKPANILLDANFISKLADFGLCRFIPKGSTTIAFLKTQPKGTFGYIDPKFMKTGILTTGCDLYSFGVTILRLLTGTDAIGIVEKVRTAYKGESLMTMVDPTAGQWPVDVSESLAYVGLKCCAKRKSPGLMQEIAEELENSLTKIGVDVGSTNMTDNKMTVAGSVDPLKIPEHVGSKTEKKVDLMYPQPTKKDEVSSEPKKAEDKRSKPPVSSTVCLKMSLHCDSCIKKIRKNILQFRGMESVSAVLEEDLVTVKGTMDMKELVPYLEEKLKRAVIVVDDSGNDKNGNGNAEDEKKEKDGDGDTREKGKRGDGGGKKEATMVAYYGLPYGYGGYNHAGYGGYYHAETESQLLQAFSDENTSTCYFM